MAFSKTNLGLIGGGANNAPKVFTFVDSASTKAQIDTDDYFLTVYDILDVNDVIISAGSDGVVILAVTASASTGVDTEEATLA